MIPQSRAIFELTMKTKTHKLKRFTLPLMAASLLSSCAVGTISSRGETAQRIAAPAFMIERTIPANPFMLTAFERVHDTGGTSANVYIEGDGLAWVSKTRRSLDPTPKNPVSLSLASRDDAKNVIYLARPCQYSKLIDNTKPCPAAYWTNKRYAPEVLSAYNEALDNIRTHHNVKSFNLVGFSGGGTVAALLAASRSDIASLRTVAGNLDHAAHSRYHNVSKLNGSLNPPDYAARLRDVPQIHYVGAQDSIVPSAILHSYMQALGDTSCVRYDLVQGASHSDGWSDKWPALLAEKPDCKR